MNKILLITLLTMPVFAGGSSTTGDGSDWFTDNAKIVDIMRRLPNDIQLRKLSLDVGESLFDKKLKAYIMQTEARKLLVKEKLLINKYEELREEIIEIAKEGASFEQIAEEVDLHPFIQKDFLK